jgi:hypothetical protein
MVRITERLSDDVLRQNKFNSTSFKLRTTYCCKRDEMTVMDAKYVRRMLDVLCIKAVFLYFRMGNHDEL